MKPRVIAASALLAMGLGLAAASAQAMPVNNVPGPNSDNTLLQEAAFGCGPGWTRGPYGHCRPKYTCPPGFHTGPEGFHCFRNVVYRPFVYGGWGWHPHRWHRWHNW